MKKENIEFWLKTNYPLTIVKDRYNGCYSKGKYVAFPQEPWEIDYRMNGNDVECISYWDDFQGIAGKGNTPKEAFKDLKNNMTREFIRLKETKQEITLPEGYIFKDENGNVINASKIVLEKKKPKYPTTYEECCDILQIEHTFELNGLMIEEEALLKSFIHLKRCRDAYWKIAEDWEPNFTSTDEDRYGIYTANNKVVLDFSGTGDVNIILTFPTEEMRDAFYENFKDLIEECKELL